jgi:hypothetical protein
MRIDPRLERYRVHDGLWGSNEGDDFGSFRINPGPFGEALHVIASPGDENIQWEHVSVSTRRRCPTWKEMSLIKDLFWDQEETVMQLHPPKSTWINNHPYCLHLWRPLHIEIPLPPSIAVGYKALNLEAK